MSREPKSKVTGQEPEAVQSGEQPVVKVENPITGEATSSVVIKRKDKFLKGMWANKSDPNEPDKVVITVNGEPIMWQRGVETIVPECYYLAAKDAVYNKYSVKPSEGRKVSARISRFPFTITGESTYDEFRAAFAAGSKFTREAVAIHGLNIPVAKSVPQLD